jgi:hypothetical protein
MTTMAPRELAKLPVREVRLVVQNNPLLRTVGYYSRITVDPK